MAMGQEWAKCVQPGAGALHAQGVRSDVADDAEGHDGDVHRQDVQPGRAGRQDAGCLLTLAGLTMQGAQAEAQIRLTVRHAIEAGATKQEIAETIGHVGMFGGIPAMTKAMELART